MKIKSVYLGANIFFGKTHKHIDLVKVSSKQLGGLKKCTKYPILNTIREFYLLNETE